MVGPRLFVLNANTTTAITELIAAGARAAARPGTSITVSAAPFGPAYIQSRAEATIAAHGVLTGLARAKRPIDVAVIACFGEPGLFAARELFDFPVVGMAEAAMVTACQLGRRFAILTTGARWPAMLDDLVDDYGLRDRHAGTLALPVSGLQASRNRAAAATALVRLARRAERELEADVVILGGAGLAGLAPQLRTRCELPVVDGLAAAIAQAEALAQLRPGTARTGQFARPSSAGFIGIDATLAKALAKPGRR
jgi:Asp/Glu/hydantoin racemase